MTSVIGVERRRRLALGAVAVVVMTSIILLCSAKSSFGYEDNWSCSRHSQNHCTDPGSFLHSWIGIVTIMDPLRDEPTLCAKAETSSGALRSGATALCHSHVAIHQTCLISDTPLSVAYGYWRDDSDSTSRGMDLTAQTPSSATFC
jgi:hypothetical protein